MTSGLRSRHHTTRAGVIMAAASTTAVPLGRIVPACHVSLLLGKKRRQRRSADRPHELVIQLVRCFEQRISTP